MKIHQLTQESTVSLEVRSVPQEHLTWCWAACGESVFAFHAVTLKQCEQVRRLVGAADCCVDPNRCAHLATPADVTKNFENSCFQAKRVDDLTFEGVAAEIKVGRPVLAGIDVLTVYGAVRYHHVVVICGCDEADRSVLIMNPMYGDFCRMHFDRLLARVGSAGFNEAWLGIEPLSS